MNIEEKILERFKELKSEAEKMPLKSISCLRVVERRNWGKWSTSALNLLEKVFGENSAPFQKLKNLDVRSEGRGIEFDKFHSCPK